jgi:hypothetical protein
VELARPRHGGLVDRFAAVFEERGRQEHLMHVRRRLPDSDLRFLLALLVNRMDRLQILELVQERKGSAPERQITRWLAELSRLGLLDGLRLDEGSLQLVETLLTRRNGDSPQQCLAAKYGGRQVRKLMPEIDALIAILHRSALLLPLLSA